MQKTIIGKFPPRNPQQQQQLQPRLGHGQKNLSPRENHYVIQPPEEMPAADTGNTSRNNVPNKTLLVGTFLFSVLGKKINQKQDEGICSPSKDCPCSLPTVHMISSGSLSLISHPLSALPLQFQADPEDDDYIRSTGGTSGVGISRFFGHRCSTPISETTPLSVREGKISAQASDLKTPALLLLTNGDPEDSDQPTRRRSSRFQSGSIPPPHWPPSVEEIPTVDVPICQLLADFRASLLQRMQSIFLDPSHATLRPGLEGLTSTVLTAMIGLEKTLQPLYPQRRGAFVGLAVTPAKVPTPERRVSLPFGKASESDSGTTCCSASQLDEGSHAQHSAGGLFSAPTGSPARESNERVVARKFTPQTREKAEGWDGTIGGHLDSFGKPRSAGPRAPLPGRRAALWPGEPASCRISAQRA
jgi:hypothetical protein